MSTLAAAIAAPPVLGHIVVLQEARGSAEDLAEIHDMLPRWLLGAFLPQIGGGGVGTLISTILAELHTDISQQVFFPGRMQKLSLRGGSGPLVDVWNIHIVSSLRLSIEAQVQLLGSSLAPLGDIATIVLGHFNMLALGKGRHNAATGSGGAALTEAPDSWFVVREESSPSVSSAAAPCARSPASTGFSSKGALTPCSAALALRATV